MKKMHNLIILILFVCLIPLNALAAGNVTVNQTTISVERGKTATFKITATNTAAKVTISSSDSSVITVDKTLEWVENQTITITATGKATGTASINVVVDGATFDEEVIKKNYTINVNVLAPKSSDNNITSLIVDGTILEEFSKDKLNYNLSNTNNSSIVVNAVKSDSKATISGLGTKALNYGKNTFKIIVTAENGAKKTYTININRNDNRSSVNTLKTLSLSHGVINFNSKTTTYNVNVASDISKITINSELSDEKASYVKGYGNREVTIKNGKNVILIKVKAENGSVKTYTLNINKEVKNEVENVVKDITINDYQINFNKDVYEYTIKIKDEVSLDFDVILTNSKATYEILENNDLDNGSVITVRVKNDEDIFEYKFNIEKDIIIEEPIVDSNNDENMKSDSNKNLLYISIVFFILSFIIFIGSFIYVNKNK